MEAVAEAASRVCVCVCVFEAYACAGEAYGDICVRRGGVWRHMRVRAHACAARPHARTFSRTDTNLLRGERDISKVALDLCHLPLPPPVHYPVVAFEGHLHPVALVGAVGRIGAGRYGGDAHAARLHPGRHLLAQVPHAAAPPARVYIEHLADQIRAVTHEDVSVACPPAIDGRPPTAHTGYAIAATAPASLTARAGSAPAVGVQHFDVIRGLGHREPGPARQTALTGVKY